ncbi:lactonase family protein [Staphylococcus warneri]|uniref:6-phosphogluconolactonase n=1 Tax=Staphylococcus warneri TaxID=1292 RepID=UPI003CEBCD7D
MTKGYIGSYTKKNGQGIYQFDLDEQNGQIVEVATGYQLEASTYVTRNNHFLYAITKEGDNCGVASFRIAENGELTLINKCLASQKGTGCYVQVSTNGEFLFEAIYGAGLARIYQLNPTTGEIERLIQELAHDYPLGPHERQEHPHVHFLNETPDGQYVVAADLGTDRLVSYTFSENGLKEHAVSEFNAADGTRHIAFHENGKYAYVVHELSNIVSVTKYEDGRFKELERHLTIPEHFDGATKLAAVHLSHDQQFLYVSNRGHDSIAIYKVLENGAKLELVYIVKSGDEFPRDFNITESDDYLVCAHQEGQSKLTVFERDKEKGTLTLKDQSTQAPEGVCVMF